VASTHARRINVEENGVPLQEAVEQTWPRVLRRVLKKGGLKMRFWGIVQFISFSPFIVIAVLLALATLAFPFISYAVDGKIAFASDRLGNFDIYIMDEDGGQLENITEHPAIDISPSWTPDGNTIVFERRRLGIYTISIDKPKLKFVTNGSGMFPMLAPDGKQIAYVENPIGVVLWLSVVSLTGENHKRIRRLNDINDKPHTWSPDGSQIAFCDNNGYLYIFDLSSGNCERIPCTTPDGKEVRAIDVDWSPVGNKLAIASYGDTKGLWVKNDDGSNAKRITKNEDRAPEWSPDGTQIAFQSWQDGDWDIYIIDADGRNRKCLTMNNVVSDMHPAWFRATQSVSTRNKLTTMWGKLKEF